MGYQFSVGWVILNAQNRALAVQHWWYSWTTRRMALMKIRTEHKFLVLPTVAHWQCHCSKQQEEKVEKEDSKEEKEQVQVEGANYDGFRCLGCCNLESWQPELHLQWHQWPTKVRSHLFSFWHSRHDTSASFGNDDDGRVGAWQQETFFSVRSTLLAGRHVKNARRDGGGRRCLVILVAFFIISMSASNVFSFWSHSCSNSYNTDIVNTEFI